MATPSTRAAAAKTMAQLSATFFLLPSIPIAAWYYNANSDRQRQIQEVQTKVRIPNVQTIDDLMVEKCQPGDIVLFDRRCHKCAAGPMAAFSCLLGKQFLCDTNNTKSNGHRNGTSRKMVDIGQFEHVGIIVPGYNSTSSNASKLDPSNLLLLEATAGEGVVARPLLQRLEMSQSRTVLLLPLASPGEHRNENDNDDYYEPSPKTIKLQQHMNKGLIKFRDEWISASQKQNYTSSHSTLTLFGALGYAMNLYKVSKLPVSPAAFLTVSALIQSGAGLHVNDRVAYEAKVEDFLRDYRFAYNGEGVIRLRPGWRFMAPVVMRETSKS
eukprot:CAMPEP_0203670900 /NCGR_PEP_ID=MMETSP0090-20130426/6859_1 /ASSEMBLY_ACC=CAM_ASM_001088 /TAXON_ID=426623 /ORGANISM="Chaetoceros affinis, Strain CCMP159" /LENGTH=325 /DNA_ID=CAMNT_0050535877 /DNA_START=74 /DNA_END=1051 /DNA_ORIENTATION=-